MVNVLEVIFSFLERTFSSQQHSIALYVPATDLPGNLLRPFSLMNVLGMTRSLACKVLLEAASCLQLWDEQLKELYTVLRSCLQVKVYFVRRMADGELLNYSLLWKMKVSDSVRPDVLCLLYSFKENLRKNGEEITKANMKAKVMEYNALSNVPSLHISELELKVLLMLLDMTESFIKALDYHWQNYRAIDSAIPLRLLGHQNAFHGDLAQPKTAGVWVAIYQGSPGKSEFCLLMHLAVFLKKVKEHMRLKKSKVNWKYMAPKFRAWTSDPEMVYRLACVWVHFRKEIEQKLTAEEFQEIERMFLEGALDRELVDKIKAENPTLCLADFRFLSIFQGKDPSVSLSSVTRDDNMHEAQKEADLVLATSTMRVQQLKLKKETDLWDDFSARDADFENKKTASQRKLASDQQEQLKTEADKYCNVHFPIFVFETEELISGTVAGSVAAFCHETLLLQNSALFVYWGNLTVCGTAFTSCCRNVVRVMTDAINHAPIHTVAILFPPNVGARGCKYQEKGVMDAFDDIEANI